MIGELAVPHSVLREIVGARVEHAEILLPGGTAVHGESVEALRSKEGHDVAPVGEWSRVRVGRLDVSFLLRHTLVGRLGPDGFSGEPVERHHHPSLRRAILRRGACAVEPRLEGRIGAAADRRRDEDAIAPDDRARMRETRDGDFPFDVRAADSVPGAGQILAVRHARCRRAAETRPGGGCRRMEPRGRCGCGQAEYQENRTQETA